jgi:hypothetical protein
LPAEGPRETGLARLYLALNFEYEDDDEYEAGDMLPNFVPVLVLLLVLDNGIFEMSTDVYFRTDEQQIKE